MYDINAHGHSTPVLDLSFTRSHFKMEEKRFQWGSQVPTILCFKKGSSVVEIK